MDVFMMSSSFEGLPIALLEAMSMSCAIVSTNAGGIKEVLRHGEDGLIEVVDDWKKLSNSILLLVDDNEKLNYFQNNARDRVVMSFSIKTMVAQLEKLYLDQQKNDY